MHSDQVTADQFTFIPATVSPIRTKPKISFLILETQVCPIEGFLFRLHVNSCIHCEDLLFIQPNIIGQKQLNIYVSSTAKRLQSLALEVLLG